MKSEWQNCPLLEENATAQSVENWGRNIKTKQSPNPSVSHQPCSCSSPPICKPTTGGAGFAPRQSYNRCYLAHIWTEVRKKKKSHLSPNPARRLQLSFKKLPRLGKDNTATARAQACAGAAILLPRHPLCRAENSASRHTHTQESLEKLLPKATQPFGISIYIFWVLKCKSPQSTWALDFSLPTKTATYRPSNSQTGSKTLQWWIGVLVEWH